MTKHVPQQTLPTDSPRVVLAAVAQNGFDLKWGKKFARQE
jgi:hypothetical protein